MSKLGSALLAALGLALFVPAGAHAYIYWTNPTLNTIARADPADGPFAPDLTFITGASTPIGLAVDGQHIYWVNQTTGTIGRANLDGTRVNQSFITPGGHPRAVAVNDQHIYWTTNLGHTIGRADLDGTDVEQSFITMSGNPSSIVVDGQSVFWTDALDGGIDRAPIDGSGTPQLFTPDGGADGLAIDATHIYWGDFPNPQIGRARLDDPTHPDPAFITGSERVEGLAVDAQHIYWAHGSAIARANLDGTGVDEGYIAGADHPVYIALDSFPHPTSMAVACAPSQPTTPELTSCTATVVDTARDALAPAGTVTFTSSAGGSFSPSPTCTLAPSTSSTSACTVDFTPSAGVTATITAAFSGEVRHPATSASTTVDIRATPTSPPPSPPHSSPVLSHLTITPRTTSIAGRLEGGRCVSPTQANRRHPRCNRPLALHVSYELTIPASVKLRIEQVVAGRLKSGRCVSPTHANQRRPRCTRWVAIPGGHAYASVAGINQFTLNGRLGKRPLSPGSYRMILTPTAAGATGPPGTVSFEMKR
jgi:sugar lactone lactonase YvrE